jgi:hypothetical protein
MEVDYPQVQRKIQTHGNGTRPPWVEAFPYEYEYKIHQYTSTFFMKIRLARHSQYPEVY